MLFKKKKQYFLDRIIVTPIRDRKTTILGYGDEDTKELFEQSLSQELGISRLTTDRKYTDRDIGIDLVVSDYNYGFTAAVDTGEYGLFLFLRPKVKLIARTFDIRTGDTLREFTLVQRMTWPKFIKRLLSIKRILRLQQNFDSDDLKIVLINACVVLLRQIKASNS